MYLESCSYMGHRAISLSNRTVRLIVLTDVGPRVIHYGFCDAENEFKVYPEQLAAQPSQWANYGGARLWIAPETARTYFPDNRPVHARRHDGAVFFNSEQERWPNGVRLSKQMTIRLHASSSRVDITYRIVNCGRRNVQLAPWAISVMAPGGQAILPLPPRAPWGPKNFLPNGKLVLWPYTDLSDRRWRHGLKYLRLKQMLNPGTKFPWQKIGIHHSRAWLGYYRHGHLFMKLAGGFQPGASYPDYGCNYEIYTNPLMLELESLGPLHDLAPGAAAVHIERWMLWQDVPPGASEAWIEREIASRLPQLRLRMPAFG